MPRSSRTKKWQNGETGETASRQRLYEEVNPLQVEVYRSWDGVRKMHSMFEMFEFALQQARVGTRSRHPDWDDAQVEAEARRLVTGTDIGVE